MADMISTVKIEADLLAAIMVTEGGYDRVAAKLSPQHFSEPTFSRIFEQMGILADSGTVVNMLSIARVMASDPGFISLGGFQYWSKLADNSFLSASFGFVDELLTRAKRRSLLLALDAARTMVADPAADIEIALDEFQSSVDGAALSASESRTQRLDGAFGEAVDRVEAIRRGEEPKGLCVHDWSDWDDLTGGIQPGQYLLIGGRPSMGKTALSLGVARRAAEAGRGVLYISREMDTPQLMSRMLADLIFEWGGKATFEDVKRGQVDDEDIALLRRARAAVATWPLVIVDPDRLSASQIGSLIRRHKQAFARRGETLDLVIVDYLGLVDPPAGRPNREQEVSAISQTIKNAAKASRVPIILLSQLSRAVEQRDDKRPQLSDLRDSGTLEQDADLVIFVYRAEYYLQRSEPDRTSAKWESWHQELQAARDRVEIYTAKNRQGEIIRRRGYFFGARQAIRNSDFYHSGGSYG